MQPIYLLDTNVVSEFAKKVPNHSVLEKLEKNENFCAICSVVWQEMTFGFERLPEGKRKDNLSVYMEKIKSTYEILPYDSFAAQICGEINARCEANGKTLPRFDSQIAATAIANGMILITHNTPDFEAMQENSMLKVEDWWNSSF